MANYIYPAIFTKEENGAYSIIFPDIKGCITSGENLKEGYHMANDALCLMLYELEEESGDIPEPSDPVSLVLPENSFITLISCDTMIYRQHFKSKAVKKTLTIPEWLNDIAERKNVNYSQILQNALKQYLQIDTVS